jgi:putative spermidine/putrescine transport system ATP-binding protein
LEILRISRQLGATVIYVTHDQEEALVMSDRIAIFNHGTIEQLGNGEDLYDRPESLFVADFIGESNVLRGRFEEDGAAGWLMGERKRWRVSERQAAGRPVANESPAALVVRPERLTIARVDRAFGIEWNSVEATITEVLYLGPSRKIELLLADGRPAVVRQPIGASDGGLRPGQRVQLAWRIEDAVFVADQSA